MAIPRVGIAGLALRRLRCVAKRTSTRSSLWSRAILSASSVAMTVCTLSNPTNRTLNTSDRIASLVRSLVSSFFLAANPRTPPGGGGSNDQSDVMRGCLFLPRALSLSRHPYRRTWSGGGVADSTHRAWWADWFRRVRRRVYLALRMWNPTLHRASTRAPPSARPRRVHSALAPQWGAAARTIRRARRSGLCAPHHLCPQPDTTPAGPRQSAVTPSSCCSPGTLRVNPCWSLR